MEIRKENPEHKPRSGFDYAEFVAAAFRTRGEWVAADYGGTSNPQSAVWNHVAKRFADITMRDGVVYLRIKAEEDL